MVKSPVDIHGVIRGMRSISAIIFYFKVEPRRTIGFEEKKTTF